MSEMITVHGRSINTITAEILTITAQTNQMVVMNAIEVGRRLVEAKTMVGHGEWGDYLSKEVKFSQSTANNLMKIFKEYGDKANSQALGNLPYTKMVRLLAVPEEEREEFVQQHDVADMSTRELELAIKERNAAQELLAVAQDNNRELEAQLEKTKKAEKTAKKKLQKMKDNPEIPAGMIEKLAKEAADKAERDYSEKLDAARQEAEAAAKAKADAEQALADARKTTQLASPDAAAFNVMFAQVQEDFNKLHGYLIKIRNADAELGAKCQQALHALLDSQKGRVAG